MNRYGYLHYHNIKSISLDFRYFILFWCVCWACASSLMKYRAIKREDDACSRGQSVWRLTSCPLTLRSWANGLCTALHIVWTNGIFLALMSGLFFLHFYFAHQSLLDNKLFKLLVKLKDRYYFAAFCRGERNKYQWKQRTWRVLQASHSSILPFSYKIRTICPH